MQLGGCTDSLCSFIWSHVSSLMSFLTTDQKQQHVNVCKELCKIASDAATFFSRVNSAYKSLIYGYDPETKQQFSQWKAQFHQDQKW
jgi:hypothetical protein